ncbi:hypothetical protein BJY24_006698 [Nocardia transvalensis]|uniref:Uncharacterized protein n=1 Tax=Nocardia transvalensis TaxID=37333 RepID=A0A7W9PKB4_9NOCA|nr:hypothetical protein [Nocardia transvalensis]MBB5917786.1 hypothetical protein [Nocardia transvalensis]
MPIAFETGGLQQLDPSTWGNPATGDLVTLSYIDAVPDLPAPLEDVEALRRGLTEQQAEFGCLIEAYVIGVAGQPALLRLEKFPLPDGSGLGFTAGIVLPKATCSAILKVMCRESGRSGTREAAIVPKVGFQNMFRPHPYAPDIRGKLPYNVADDAQWDAQFPDHPLTRARRWISQASRTARVDPRFAALPPFTGPVAAGAQEPDGSAPHEDTGSGRPDGSGPLSGDARPDDLPGLRDREPSAGAAETAPIPSASALGTAPRKPATAPQPTQTPGSFPRLPASAAAYASSAPAAKTTALPATSGSVNFLQPPAVDQDSDVRGPVRTDAAETTAMPAGSASSPRVPVLPADETTMLPADTPPSGSLTGLSDADRSDDESSARPTPAEDPDRAESEPSARPVLPADETTAIPTGEIAKTPDAAETTALPAGRLTREPSFPEDTPTAAVAAGAETRPIPKR